MPGLLSRELTPEEQKAAERLQQQLRRREGSRGTGAAIRQAGAQANSAAAVLAVLGEAPEADRRWLYAQLTEGPEFLVQLADSTRFSRAELLAACRGLMALDSLLDVHLARLLPGRQGDSVLSPESAVQVLDVLDEISPGGRLIQLLNHLTQHPDSRIASRATLFIGKRLRNPEWVSHLMASPDDRVRASVVESLWDASARAACRLRAALKDKNNRVVGNALIGLHHLGEQGVVEFVKQMIRDRRPPFRWTAAWVMGKIGSREFIELLQQAVQDKDAQVRRSAERALTAIQQAPAAQAPAGEEKQAAAPGNSSPRPSPSPPCQQVDIRYDGKYVTRI